MSLSALYCRDYNIIAATPTAIAATLRPICPAALGFSAGEEGLGVPDGPAVPLPVGVGMPEPLGLDVSVVAVVVPDAEEEELLPEASHLMEPSWTGLVAIWAGLEEVKSAEPGLSIFVSLWEGVGVNRDLLLALRVLEGLARDRGEVDAVGGDDLEATDGLERWKRCQYGLRKQGRVEKLTSNLERADFDVKALELGITVEAGRLLDLDRRREGRGDERGNGSEGGEGLHLEYVCVGVLVRKGGGFGRSSCGCVWKRGGVECGLRSLKS
jgi:hypothetical protein